MTLSPPRRPEDVQLLFPPKLLRVPPCCAGSCDLLRSFLCGAVRRFDRGGRGWGNTTKEIIKRRKKKRSQNADMDYFATTTQYNSHSSFKYIVPETRVYF